MQFDRARSTGRILTHAVAAALMSAALPAQAAQRAMTSGTVRTAGTVMPADDEYSLATGGSLHIVAPGVAANDASTGTATWTVSLLSGPSHGALSLDAQGGFEYTPARGFSGVDGFRYSITDGAGRGEANVIIHVVGQVDVAATASVSPARVEPGAPTTFTFRLVNQGPGDAAAVRLEVALPVRPGDVHPDARCAAIVRGRWACPMGALAAGGEVQASFTVVPGAPGFIGATATALADKDVDPSNNVVKVGVEAGRLSVDPAHVIARAPWSPAARPGADVVSEAAVVNQTLAAVTYEIQAQDATGAKPAWLAVSPASGSVDALGAQFVKVVLSPAALSPGLRRGRLHVTHDSDFAIHDVPVSFTVAFRDVPQERAEDPAIHALAGAGVTAGCRDGAFCPDQPLARAGAAVWMLLAAEGAAYQPPPAQGAFGDLSPGRAEAPYVEELARRGVIEACAQDPAHLFCPDQPLARADAAVAVLRMLEGPDYVPSVVTTPAFRDLGRDPRGIFAEEAARRGLFSACTAGRAMFCPNDGLTRGDAAVALVKAFAIPLF